MAVKIGCCGFAGRRETYFKRYPVIEVEQTFYDPPRVFTGEKWRREAPERFEFTLHAWQTITHPASQPGYRRLQTRLRPAELAQAGHFQATDVVWEGWQRTREFAVAMQTRTVLFQSPDGFHPSAEHQENLRQFFNRLREESRRTRYEFTCAWAPPAGWPEDDVAALCTELGLVHAVDPFVNPPQSTHGCYFRLNGIKGYRHHYSDEELKRLMEMLAPYSSGYCFFNTLHMREEAGRLASLRRALKAQPPEPSQDAA